MNLKKLQKEFEKKILHNIFGHDEEALTKIQNREIKTPDKKVLTKAEKKDIQQKLMDASKKNVNYMKKDEEKEEE